MLNQNLSYLDLIKKLQNKIENIRNVCVLAHVDHGKNNNLIKRKNKFG